MAHVWYDPPRFYYGVFMRNLKSTIHKLLLSASVAFLSLSSMPVMAQTTLAQAPMLTLKSAPGLVMLTMGRDLPLYKAAYNDVNDIDGDGIMDTYFKPAFRYEGYFAYDRCYDYNSGTGIFSSNTLGTPIPVPNEPTLFYYRCSTGTASPSATGSTASTKWSGNFLNWVTMARIDVLRKVLYGGKRSTDTSASSAVLERTFVPQDSTLWGKAYSATDGYNITDYAPLTQPSAGNRHLFINVTLQFANAATASDRSARFTTLVNDPLMIVYRNTTKKVWDITTGENLLLGKNPGTDPTAATIGAEYIDKYAVRVEVCKNAISSLYEDFCTAYVSGSTTKYKPTGLLHKYATEKTLAFGLLSGSYANNYSGGVVRQNIDDFTREFDATSGQFEHKKGSPTVFGIAYHLDQFRPWGFGIAPGTGDAALGRNDWSCGAFEYIPLQGRCMMWGNPLGEMMFETLNYFGGGSPTPAFRNNLNANYTYNYQISVPGYTDIEPRVQYSPEVTNYLNLKNPDWINPYVASASRKNTAAYPSCARPIQLTIGDPKTSYDSDQLPGKANFTTPTGFGDTVTNNISGPGGSLNVGTESDLIWSKEFTGTKKFFVGESLSDTGNSARRDGNPTPKIVSSFKDIRGHASDRTQAQGSYYGAAVAHFGKVKGLSNPALPGQKLTVDQISVALDSHVPEIKLPTTIGGVTKYITLVPFAKSVKENFISRKIGDVQQTATITSFNITSISNPGATNAIYKYRISYSDTDQGNDNESDAIVDYEIKFTSASKFTVGMLYYSASNGIEMHMGYVMSGTGVQDGVYMDVAGAASYNTPFTTVNPASINYYLDTLSTEGPNKTIKSAQFRPGQSPADGTNIPGTKLPLSTLSSPRTFNISSTTTANGEHIPHDMLWYAAKYGSATKDVNGNYTFNLRQNGDPDNYYFASNPAKLSEQLGEAFQKAATLAVATASAVATSGVKVQGGDFVYQAGFDSEKWGGELRAFKVKNDGTLENTPEWRATEKLPSAASRNVVFGRALSAPLAINVNSYSSLTTVEKLFFGNNELRFKYLMGDRANERSNGGALRNRTSAPNDTSNNNPTIGDIVNSDPLYIGAADFAYSDSSYATFKASNNPLLVGAGSNDGMYRLVNAQTGVERLAYMPYSVLTDINKLPNYNYAHQYYVDGPSGFGHVKIGSTPAWRNIVVSGLGAGGKSIFAIDTAPTGTNTTLGTTNVLWEKSGSAIGDGIYLGNIMNKPIIGMIHDSSKPAVIVGNGINSNAFHNRASLLVYNAGNGNRIKFCTPTDAAGNAAGNGMTSVSAVRDSDGEIVLVYAADYLGNIWRFDVAESESNCSSNAVKVFTAKNSSGANQAITGELTVIKAPNNLPGYMILFGTGRYNTVADISNTDIQSLYGVYDNTSATNSLTRANLVNYLLGSYDAAKLTRQTAKQADANGGKTWWDTGSTAKGWVIDLTCTGCGSGERMLDKPLVNGTGNDQTVYFLSIAPGVDVCKVGGSGWLTGINATSGAYTQIFNADTANSAQASGVTPRGLFISTNASGDDFINLTVNDNSNSSNPDISSVFTDGGGQTVGSDYSRTRDISSELYKPPPCTVNCGGPSGPKPMRRQIWRQLQ